MRKLSALILALLLIAPGTLFFIQGGRASDDLIDSYPTSERSTNWNLADVHPADLPQYSAVGQAFTTNALYKVTSCKFYFDQVGSPTGYLQCRIYEVTGTVGSSAVPTGDALAYSSFLYSGTMATDYTLYEFTFTGSNSINLEASHNYAVVVIAYNSTINGSNLLSVGIDSSGTHAGNGVGFNNGNWVVSSNRDTIFYIYGLSDSLIASNEAYTNNENGDLSSFSSYWVRSGTIEASGYIFSLNYGAGYVNDTWTAFSGINNVWANLTKTLTGSASQIGNTVYYKTYANASNGLWYVSATNSFILQATVTFYFNSGGHIERNDTAINNATSTSYTTPTYLKMDALANSTYQFLSWNLTNSIASSLDNPYSFSVVNKTSLSCSFAPGGSGSGGGLIKILSSGYSETDLFFYVMLGSCSALFFGFVLGRKRH